MRRPNPHLSIIILLALLFALSIFIAFRPNTVPVTNNTEQVDEYPLWRRQLAYQASLPPTEGQKTETSKFLAIVIPTVYRERNYLHKTLQSLVTESDPTEQADVVIIIFLADTDPHKKVKQKERVKRHFPNQLDSGFFTLIESSPDIYPPTDFTNSKRTFNDPIERVTWRSKQVIDFTFLFLHTRSLSTFTLVLEDDVLSATSYITAIKDFIQYQNRLPWVALHFSQFTGIALLFRNSHLQDLTAFLLLFHREKPVDVLMRQFIDLKAPEENLPRRFPSLFQHIGTSSTFSKKTQRLTDETFELARRMFKNQNPIANLFTSMTVLDELFPDYAYRTAPGVFEATASASDTFDIVFHQPQNLERVYIVSGLRRPGDSSVSLAIANGTLQASRSYQQANPSNATSTCNKYIPIADFTEGVVDVRRSETIAAILDSVRCLRISIGGPANQILVIREIQVFLQSQNL